MDEVSPSNEKMQEMNQALLLGSIRQHELTDEAEKLNAQLVEMNEALLRGGVRQHGFTEKVKKLNARLRATIQQRQETARELAETARTVAASARELAEKARLLDLSNDAIIVRNVEGLIQYWNHGAEELYGWSREEALGKVSHDLFQTEFLTPLAQITEELERTGRWTGELVHTKRDGQRLCVLVRKTLDRDSQGNPAAVLQNITDITDRKRAEEALSASEARFRAMADAIPQLAWTAHTDGFIHWYNRRWYEYTGTTAQEMEGWGWQKVHDAETLPKVLERWKGCVASGETFEMVFPLRGADGRFRSFLTRVLPLKDAGGRVTQWFGTNTDVEELTRVEEALRASEQQFASIFNQTTGGIAESDLSGRFVLVNDRFCQLMGRSREELLRLRIQNLTHPEDLVASLEKFGALVEGSIPSFVMEKRYLRPDGSVLWGQADVASIRDLEGRVRSVTAAVTDVTEHHDLEDALVARAEELARADRSKDEFLAMLAHELRNPLAPLRNASEILKTADASPEECAQAQRILARQIENMTRMIDDLLDVSRITEGKIELRRKTVALADILYAAVSLARPGIDARGSELAIMRPGEPVFLHADATRLEQVFGNLLTNACKYSGPGSHIVLSVERAAARGEDSPQVIVRIRDDGIGIAPDLLPHIFDLFVQATRSLDRTHGGLGIGLTLVHRLVKLHGGSVEARSEGLGCGSEFIVRLPILRAAPPPPAPPPPVARETPRRMLIVDDNEDSARSMAVLQRRRGHETRTAFTGPDAVTAAAEFAPEVVLLDIGLPGMDGYEVARQLRAMPALAGTFLVAMSGYGSDQDRARARAAGFDEYLVKPADLDLLRSWLGSRT